MPFNDRYEDSLITDIDEILKTDDCCVVSVVPRNISICDHLIDVHTKISLISILSALARPINVKIHLHHDSGCMLRLAQFSQAMHKAVNSIADMVGSTVIADLEKTWT